LIEYKIVVSPQFNKSLQTIFADLNPNQTLELAKAIDNLKQNISIFPESYPLVQFERYCEIPFRKPVIKKQYIVVYFFQQEKVFLVNFYYASENWKYKILH